MYFILHKNVLGKDYVVGDLHGHYEELLVLLNHVEFNPEVDRLFLVGDLVDRGPYSMECLELLRNPWVYAVRGNHEDLLSMSFKHDCDTFHRMNGGSWAYKDDVDEPNLLGLLDLVNALPNYIEVEGSFSVMHAEPPSGKQDLLDYNMGNWMATNTYRDEPCVHWGRAWFYNFYGKDPTKIRCQPIPRSSVLQTVYVGHTPVRQPLRLGFLVNLDTGAGKGGKLTMHCHTTNKTLSYSPTTGLEETTIFVYDNKD